MSRKDLVERLVVDGYEIKDEWDAFEHVMDIFGYVSSEVLEHRRLSLYYGPAQILDGEEGEESIFKGFIVTCFQEVVDFIEAFDYDILNIAFDYNILNLKDICDDKYIYLDENDKFILDIGREGKHFFYMKGSIEYFYSGDLKNDYLVITFKDEKDVDERFFG